jgi:hypothetical protein
MARQTVGERIVSILKREMAPSADGEIYEVRDGYNAGGKHRVPTKDELRAGRPFGARGGDAEGMNTEYSSNAPQRGAQLTVEHFNDTMDQLSAVMDEFAAGVSKCSATILLSRARDLLAKADAREDEGNRPKARILRKRAAKLLRTARAYATDSDFEGGAALRKSIRALLKRTDVIVQEQGEDEEEEDDGDGEDAPKAWKASRKIDEDEAANQRKWADDNRERSMGTKSATVADLLNFLANGTKGLHPKHAGMIKSGAVDVAIVASLNAAMDSRRISPEARAAALNVLNRAAVATSGGDYSKRQVQNDIANLPASVRDLPLEVA